MEVLAVGQVGAHGEERVARSPIEWRRVGREHIEVPALQRGGDSLVLAWTPPELAAVRRLPDECPVGHPQYVADIVLSSLVEVIAWPQMVGEALLPVKFPWRLALLPFLVQ